MVQTTLSLRDRLALADQARDRKALGRLVDDVQAFRQCETDEDEQADEGDADYFDDGGGSEDDDSNDEPGDPDDEESDTPTDSASIVPGLIAAAFMLAVGLGWRVASVLI